MFDLFQRRTPIARMDPSRLMTTRIGLQDQVKRSIDNVNRLADQLNDTSKQILNAPGKLQKLALMPAMNSTLVQMKLEGANLRGTSAQLNMAMIAEAIKSYQSRGTQNPIIKKLLGIPAQEVGMEMARMLGDIRKLDEQSSLVVSQLSGIMEQGLPRELEEFLHVTEDVDVQSAIKEDPEKAAELVSKKVMKMQGIEPA